MLSELKGSLLEFIQVLYALLQDVQQYCGHPSQYYKEYLDLSSLYLIVYHVLLGYTSSAFCHVNSALSLSIREYHN